MRSGALLETMISAPTPMQFTACIAGLLARSIGQLLLGAAA